MADNIAQLIEHSFLARVPDLILSGMSIEEAIATAKERDDQMCLMLIAPESWQQEAAEEMKALLCRRVYERLRALPAVPAPVNPRWVTCERELGRRPSPLEFILWCHAQRGGG